MLTLVSGGQTGVDRAALDLALARGLPCGGWLPRGRQAEDGALPARYPLHETDSPDYAERTRLNVRDSDATLILCPGPPSGGTALTVACARELGRPCRVIDLDDPEGAATTAEWVRRHGVGVLNVAGPRESTCPGVYRRSFEALSRLLDFL